MSLGVGSVEADIHLVDGKLYIGHGTPTNITLSEMYLDPLEEKIAKDGYIWDWDSKQPLNILIDVKTTAGPTFDVLHTLIASNYSDLFTSYTLDSNKQIVETQRYVNCIISGEKKTVFFPLSRSLSLSLSMQTPHKGNRAWGDIESQNPRYCTIDSPDVNNVTQLELSEMMSPMVSMEFSAVFGKNTIHLNESQQKMLADMIGSCRKYNKRLRFWGGDNSIDLWTQMIEIDGEKNTMVLNADLLREATEVLEVNDYNNTNQGCEGRTPAWCVE